MSGNFRAFISYSHRDIKRAKALHSQLENYRLPKGLTDLPEGWKPRDHVRPIFRDTEDLSAVADLSSAVQEALSNSAALIVICTPSAKASPWVAQEIEYFQQAHPERPILAALFKGEPEEAFPELITQAGEPVAGDFRKDSFDNRLAFLKLVAGLTQLPLDSLRQRDERRRRRRVISITAISVALCLIMAAMTIQAVLSRQEAERQRSEAESLIEFMLTDLRTDLRGVGRLDVMDRVNTRAMAYYNDLGDLSLLADESLERRARILLAMGEDDEKACRWEDASARFGEAHRATANLLGRSPNNPDRIFAHAQSEYWVGWVAWQQDDYSAVETHWGGYLDQAEALAQVEPETVRSFKELGYANGNMCEFLGVDAATRGQALAYCQRAIDFDKQAVSMEPDNISNIMALANRHGWMADALLVAGNQESALEQRQFEQALIGEQLEKNPLNLDLQLRATWPLIGMGQLEVSRGRYDEGLVLLGSAREKLSDLAVQSPENASVPAMLIRTIMLMARARKEDGEADWTILAGDARARFEELELDDSCQSAKQIEKMLEL